MHNLFINYENKILWIFYSFCSYISFDLLYFMDICKSKKKSFQYYYYLLQPFLKSNMLLDKYFPDKYWALAIPAYGASLTYSFSFIFLGWIFLLSFKEKNNEIEDKVGKKKSFHQKNQQIYFLI